MVIFGLQHVTDLSGRETLVRITGMLYFSFYCFTKMALYDFVCVCVHSSVFVYVIFVFTHLKMVSYIPYELVILMLVSVLNDCV